MSILTDDLRARCGARLVIFRMQPARQKHGTSAEFARARGAHRITRCAALAVILFWVCAGHGSDGVVIAFTDKGPYREAAGEIAKQLRAGGRTCEIIEIAGDGQVADAAYARIKDARPRVIVTGGPMTTAGVLGAVPDVPVVFFMVPNARDAAFFDASGQPAPRVCGVTSDPSPAEQVDWLRKTAPAAGRIAVLCSENSRRTARSLEDAGKPATLELVAIEAQADRFPDAMAAVARGKFDGVLAIPDAQVYNSANVQYLLLWGARERRPVWGFSDKVVKAGALAGIYAASGDVGRQTAAVVEQIWGGTKPEQIGLQYPKQLSRGINAHTAETIGANLDAARREHGVESYGAQP